ncbi:cytochrome P450 [Streptomyces sp. WI03-4A]|uniref:cytochrome P450 n=1 Tax=Streptomyces sp. WI03-4A TaxID=3028706 RepID=UPI0029ACC6C1|nr:cytochrome P450 [Streptomyces sp. WI03-4A]MDX2592023.1 cytochrome P450 [Streptomyces sp. WI03-4A]
MRVAYPAVLDWPLARVCPLSPPPALGVVRDGPPTLVRLPAVAGEEQRVWLITRYEDVKAALKDPRLSADETRPGFPLRIPVPTDDRPSGFLRMDDPEHGRLRRMVAPEFTARRVRMLRPRLQELTDRAADALAAGPHPADLVRDFAAHVSALVIARLLGIPDEHTAFFLEQTRILLTDGDPALSLAAHHRIIAFLDETARAKEKQPGDDLVSRLVTNHVATGELDRADLLGILKLLLIAGHESTATQIAFSALSLLTDDGLRAEVLADGGALLPAFVEESMRFWSIIQDSVVRQATEDVRIGETLVGEGESVMISLLAANHDATVFPRPERLDIHRDASGHLLWGHGAHFCLGASLGRLEVTLALGSLFTALPTLRLACEVGQLRLREHPVFHSLTELPVTW